MARGLRHSWPEGLYHWHLLVEIIICHYGIPDELLSDRGANCLSELIQICKELGVKKVSTSGYHPQTNGLVEKFNPTLINVIAKYCEKWNHDWDQHLSHLLLHTYHVSIAKSQTESPFYPSNNCILEVYHAIYDLSSTCNCWNSKWFILWSMEHCTPCGTNYCTFNCYQFFDLCIWVNCVNCHDFPYDLLRINEYYFSVWPHRQ